MKTITALIILDGFGYSQATTGNAITADGTKNIRRLMQEYPHTTIKASGLDVGLPDGQMGNSEVGHLNIGAGRIVYQELTRITKSIADGDFFEKAEFRGAMNNAQAHDSSLHIMGLCSDGGVHSHLDHMYALVELAKRRGLKKVYIHCFMDGRDVPPKSGKCYIEQVEAKLAEIGCGKIATVMGRYYAMDRDNRFERVKQAYDAMAGGIGIPADSAVAAMEAAYAAGDTDEFVKPSVIMQDGKPVATIGAHDSIIFFNFRPDRAREITRAFIQKSFSGFERTYFPVHFVSFTQYDATFTNLSVAFKPETLEDTFGEYISKKGLKQLRIAETEKYAHVTFFFNGGVEEPLPGEDRALIPSPKVATYDLKPEMSAYEVTDEAIRRIESGEYDVMILNLANPDMVGHTGIMEAAIKAIHVVDECTARIVDAILKQGGRCIITADHGNCEKMRDALSGEPFTAHTTDPVPVILVDDARKTAHLRSDGRLSDLAPTLLDLLDLEKPAAMTGKTLIDG